MPLNSPQKTSFVGEFLRDRNVAAISPSSPFLMKRLLRRLGSLAEARLVIELGPGDGVAMREILPRLSPEARYVAVERNPNFAALLRSAADARVTVLEGSAQELRAHATSVGAAVGTADAVIASIPFTYLSHEERVSVMAAAKAMLRPGGAFVIFHQYSPLMEPYVKKEFGAVTVEFEPLNVLPCFLLSATR